MNQSDEDCFSFCVVALLFVFGFFYLGYLIAQKSVQPTPTATNECEYGPAIGNSGECALSPAYAAPQPTSTTTNDWYYGGTVILELEGNGDIILRGKLIGHDVELGKVITELPPKLAQ
jgi:hypothetical protein